MAEKNKAQEQGYRERFLKKAWEWLDKNFHKFSEPVKVKIAVALCGKDIPQELHGKGFGDTKIIIVRDEEDKNGNDIGSIREEVSKEVSAI